MGEETLSNMLIASHSLRRLDMSHLQLSEVPTEITDQLHLLEKLDLSDNKLNDDSFPSNMRNLTKLFELCAHNNYLTHVPKTLTRLRNLTRLKLGSNKLTTLEGVEKLKKLTMLVLDSNEIESLTRDLYMHMKKLEILHLSKNRLKEITGDVRFLRQLKDLDISDNNLTVLPAEVFLLPKMDAMNASNNNLARLPTIVLKGKQKTKMSSLDLSGNVITKFPEHLLLLTDR